MLETARLDHNTLHIVEPLHLSVATSFSLQYLLSWWDREYFLRNIHEFAPKMFHLFDRYRSWDQLIHFNHALLKSLSSSHFHWPITSRMSSTSWQSSFRSIVLVPPNAENGEFGEFWLSTGVWKFVANENWYWGFWALGKNWI